MKKLALLICFTIFISHFYAASQYLYNGHVFPQLYYCSLQLKKDVSIDFQLRLSGNDSIELINGNEKIDLQFSGKNGDSLKYNFPVFDAGIVFIKRIGNNLDPEIIGYYFTNYRHINIPFSGSSPDDVFINPSEPIPVINGQWRIVFSPNTKDSSFGLGEFESNINDYEENFSGTILTSSGDFRYLHGNKNYDDTIRLYTFDGAHVYAFIMTKQPDGSLKGTQYSGTWAHEDFVCTRQPGFQLPDAYSLVKMQLGKNTFDFVLLEENGWPLSLNSKEYAHKPMLIQVMGSWCPNCMYESRYIISQYPDWHNKGLEVLGLCFEKYDDSATAYRRIAKMSNDLKMPYFATLAGKASVKEVFKLLPEMEGDVSFPTLIALDKNHHVKWIHTGFSGPATGMAYLQWKEEMEKEVAELVK